MNFLAAAAYQESRFAEFTNLRRCGPTVKELLALTDGYPAQACDNGYGIMQLTNGVPGGLNNNLPPKYWTGTPTQDMVWNWVSNLNAGTWVMINKLNEEIAYEKRMVNQQNAYYLTPEQRQMNVWQRYNGGIYLVWSLCAIQVNGVCTAGWERNDPWCNDLIPNVKTHQNLTCNGAFPQGGKCYADCAKYWAQTTPGSSSGWCK